MAAYERMPEIFRLQQQVETDVAEFTTEAPQLKDDAEYVMEQLERLRNTPNQSIQQVGQRLMELRTYWQDQVYRETQKNALHDVRTLLQAQTTEYARKAGTSANELYRRNEMAKIRKRRKQWKDIKKTLTSMHAQNQLMRRLVVQSAQLQSATEADRQCQAATTPSQACRHKGAEDCAQDPHCAVVGSMCVTVQEPSRMELCDRFNDRVESEDRMCRAITQEAQCTDKCTWQLVASPFGEERQGACRAKVSEHFTWYRQNPPNLTMPLETTSSVRGYRTLEQPVAYDFQQTSAHPHEVQAKQTIGTMLEFWRKRGQNASWEQVNSDPSTDQGKLQLYLPTYQTSVTAQPDVKHWFKDNGNSFVEVPPEELQQQVQANENLTLHPSSLSTRQIQQLSMSKLAKHWAAQKDHVVVRVPRQNTQVLGFVAPHLPTNITSQQKGKASTNMCQFHHNECLSAYGLQQGTHILEPYRLRKPNVGQVNRERTLQYLRQLYSSVPQQLHGNVPEERPLVAQRPDADLSTIPGTTGMGPVEFARWKLLDDKKRQGQSLTESETMLWRRFDSIDNIKEQLLEYLTYYALPNKLVGGAEKEWYIVSHDPSSHADSGGAVTNSRDRELVPIPNHLRSALQFTVTDDKNQEIKTVSIWTQKQGEQEDSRTFLLQTDKVVEAITTCSTDQDCQQKVAVCQPETFLSDNSAVACSQDAHATCKSGTCRLSQTAGDSNFTNGGLIVQTGYYVLTSNPVQHEKTISLRNLLGETLSKTDLKSMFAGIQPNSTLFEEDLDKIQSAFANLHASEESKQEQYREAFQHDRNNFMLAVGETQTFRWTHADEKETELEEASSSVKLSQKFTFNNIDEKLFDQGSTLEFSKVHFTINGAQFVLRPHAQILTMNPHLDLRILVPYTAVKLGHLVSWDALEGQEESIRVLFKCPCFLLRTRSNMNIPVPYKKRIYFREPGQMNALRLNEPPTLSTNPGNGQYEVYYIEEYNYMEEQEPTSLLHIRKVMCQAAEIYMRASAVLQSQSNTIDCPRQFVFNILTDGAGA